MTLNETINQLESLRQDRESFLDGDDDEIYQADIEAIDKAIEAVIENVDMRKLLKQASETINRLGTAAQDCKTCARLTLCNADCCYRWSGSDEAERLTGGG